MNEFQAKDETQPVASTEARASHSRARRSHDRALGVVFGDIGTSPIYAFRESIKASGSSGNPGVVFGVLHWCFGRSSSLSRSNTS